jgi:hypothetical protein
MYQIISFKWEKIKLLNNKYIIAYNIKINKGTKVFQERKIKLLNIL